MNKATDIGACSWRCVCCDIISDIKTRGTMVTEDRWRSVSNTLWIIISDHCGQHP